MTPMSDLENTQTSMENGKKLAQVARELLLDGLQRYEEAERVKQLASDYASDALELQNLVSDLEVGQLDLLGSEDD